MDGESRLPISIVCVAVKVFGPSEAKLKPTSLADTHPTQARSIAAPPSLVLAA
jgi:hypothetical protein